MSNLLEQASLVMIPSGYKEDVVYSEIPISGAGDLSFTRASNGTRVNSAGLVEVCPWNLFTYSEDFANADWIKVGSTISSNVLVAPNGTTTADKLVEDTSNGVHIALQITGGRNVSSIYAFSVYAKAGERTKINLFNNGNGVGEANFDLVNGTATLIAGEFATIESVGNGWYRCVVGMQENSTPGNFNYHIRLLDGSGSTSYTGNGTSGAYIWGAQLNIGSTAKPYFPTTDRLNVPRLTYQNGGGGCPSLLLEKQSTNLLLYSEQFDQWTTNGTTTSNVAISPDGTQNADRLNYTSGSVYWLDAGVNVTNGSTYTFTLYVKPTSVGDQFRFYIDGGFNVSQTITTDSSDWKRYEWTFTATATASINPHILLGYGMTSQSILVWGAQVEASSYATSYIPTTSSSATRVADECVKTGISSLIGQTSGSVFFDFTVDTISAQTNEPVLWYMKDAGSGERYVELFSNGNLLYIEYDGSAVIANITKTGLTVGRHKCAIAYAPNDMAFYVDGVQIGTDTSGTPSGLSTFGCQYYNSAFNGQQKINQVAIFATRLTNAELASLTTL